jgi:hypothetical protein
MSISDLMKAMADAGAPFDAILIAVRALEERDAMIEERRAVERDRKRRQRERDRDSHGTVTGQSGDNTETPAPSLSPQTPQTHPHPCKNSTRARKGTRLPADWTPKALPDELGKAVAQWPSGAVEREIDRFRDWAVSATGSVAVKSDWDAAWRNWLRKADEDGRHFRRPNGTGPPANADPMIASILAKQKAAAP